MGQSLMPIHSGAWGHGQKECEVPHPASQASLAPGMVLAKRYRIENLIGSGGYASVYRATDLTFGYERAIKEVTDADAGVRTQFRLESELLINSRHPNIPHGYHLIEDMGRMFLVMDYVRGQDLEELLNESLTKRQRPLDEAQVLEWAIEIAGALQEMHNLRMPVIHRDIKPANIKITPEGRPILIDFGLAKLHQQGPTMTAAQGVSPGFAPPEQYMAKGRTDARTDIYGLGATLYACLTGKDPPEAPARLLAQTGVNGGGTSLVSPRKLNNRISEATDRIIMKALELSPNNRQQSARELADELRAALDRLQGSGGAPAAIGLACPRCGSSNRAGASRCAKCGAALRAGEGPQRQPPPAPAETTGKRAVPPMALAQRSTAKTPVPGAGHTGGPADGQRGAPPPAPPRTGKQPAVLADGRTGKQRVATPGLANGTAAGATGMMPALPEAAGGVATKAGRSAAAQAAAEPAAKAATRAWIRLGQTPLSGFGKFMLVLSVVEFLWGAFILVLGGVAIATRGKPLPVPQLVIGWLVVVLLGSVLGAQALIRPVYRRGVLVATRRWLQGIGLVLYSLAVHGVAIWGASIFQMGQGNATLAEISFMLFGVNVLVVGALAVLNTLG
jgi:hypothetical protein